MRANAPFSFASLAAVALVLVFALVPASLHARVDKKKHASAERPAHHANAHPEANSKKRDAEAKKRLSKDKKTQKNAARQSKRHESHPVAAHSRNRRPPETAKVAAHGNAGAAVKADPAAKPNLAKVDPATETRVHAWVKSQKHTAPAQTAEAQTAQTQPSTDPHTATSADFVNAATAPASTPASSENPTGTSNPPPDNLQAAKSPSSKHEAAKPVSVVSVVRSSPGQRPQLPPVEDLAAEPVILPALYTRRGRLVVPPPLKGSHEILIRQNQVADDEGLDRIQNDDDLTRLSKAGLLIAVPSNAMLHVDERLPANRRFCRPWTALFLDTLARQHYARFQTTLQLTSAVRTVEFQQQLIHRNGNAAPAEGDTASPHLTGQAVDIGKKGLSMAEIAWLRGYLLPLVQQGKVDVEEEFQQSCFHISVYKKYLPRAGAGRRSIATKQGDGLDVLATGLR